MDEKVTLTIKNSDDNRQFSLKMNERRADKSRSGNIVGFRAFAPQYYFFPRRRRIYVVDEKSLNGPTSMAKRFRQTENIVRRRRNQIGSETLIHVEIKEDFYAEQQNTKCQI